MNRRRGLKKHPEDLARAKAAISRNLKLLEEKLKRFRSTSPEKWVDEVAKGFCKSSESFDLVSARSASEESTSSVNSDEIIKTIAENEDFIKQKIGGIEDDLRVLSTKVMPDGLLSLQEDLHNMEDGLNGLEEVIKSWEAKSKTPPKQVQKGLNALINALEELSDDAQILLKNDSLIESSEDLQTSIEDALDEIKNLDEKLKITNINRHSLEDDIERVRIKLKNIQSILDKINELSSSLSEVHKGLDNAKEEVKTKIKDLINLNNKSVESVSASFEQFTDLDEEDFQNLDSMMGYEITDYILRREEEHIFSLREDYAESLEVSKKLGIKTTDKISK